MDETQVIIEIKEGILQAVYSNKPLKYVLVDHDNIKEGDPIPNPPKHSMYEPDGTFDDISQQIKEIVK